jgi:hypothetical protein
MASRLTLLMSQKFSELPYFWVVAPEVAGSSPVTHPSGITAFYDD